MVFCLSILIGQMSKSHAADPVGSEPPVPESLRLALARVWQELNPYIERLQGVGNGEMLADVGWKVPVYDWRSKSILNRKSAKTFLLPLRTVIEHASCHGHPRAMRSLYRLRGIFRLPFLSVEHRLLLEWRALHQGADLRFFEPVRWRTKLPRISLKQSGPAYRAAQDRSRESKKPLINSDLPFPSSTRDEFYLHALSKLLRVRQFDEAIRRIPELAQLCLGIPEPRHGPVKRRHDPVPLKKTTG